MTTDSLQRKAEQALCTCMCGCDAHMPMCYCKVRSSTGSLLLLPVDRSRFLSYGSFALRNVALQVMCQRFLHVEWQAGDSLTPGGSIRLNDYVALTMHCL